MAKVEWLEPVLELFEEELPTKDQIEIVKRLALLEQFPDMYPLRRSGPFRGHRSFVAGNYLVFYKHVGDTVWDGKLACRVRVPGLLQVLRPEQRADDIGMEYLRHSQPP